MPYFQDYHKTNASRAFHTGVTGTYNTSKKPLSTMADPPVHRKRPNLDEVHKMLTCVDLESAIIKSMANMSSGLKYVLFEKNGALFTKIRGVSLDHTKPVEKGWIISTLYQLAAVINYNGDEGVMYGLLLGQVIDRDKGVVIY